MTDTLRTYTFSGPGGTRSVRAADEQDARHKAMVLRWGRPNGRPAHDTGPDGRYLSAGLSLTSVSD